MILFSRNIKTIKQTKKLTDNINYLNCGILIFGHSLNIKEAEKFQSERQFDAGSMGPKVDAILRFLKKFYLIKSKIKFSIVNLL